MRTNKSKTVLLVSYLFPPGDQVGSLRISKFQQYLSDFDYLSCVICSKISGKLDGDRTNKVFRPFEPALVYRPVLKKIASASRSAQPDQSLGTSASHHSRRLLDGTQLEKLRNWVLEWFVLPDLQILWLPGAVWTGYRVIKRENVDVIFSTSGPETNHLVGALLSILTGTPLVLDFRDGWLFEPLNAFRVDNRLRRSVERYLECWVVSKAKAVTTVSKALTEYFCITYNLPNDRCITIPNGYDPSDWLEIIAKPRSPDKLRMVHAGSFNGSSVKRSLQPFMESLNYLSEEVLSSLEVMLVGAISRSERQLVQQLGLSNHVEFVPQVPKSESLAYQLSADVLLLITGSDRSVATSKLFEYLYARRPIMAVGNPHSAACEIVRDTKSGLVVGEYENPRAIAKAIAEMHRLWQQGALDTFGEGNIDQYERRNQAGILAELLDQITIWR